MIIQQRSQQELSDKFDSLDVSFYSQMNELFKFVKAPDAKEVEEK